MKTIALKVEDDVYEKIIAFLELIPKDKIQISNFLNEIVYVDDNEQKEIEKILKDPECHEFSGYETTIEI